MSLDMHNLMSKAKATVFNFSVLDQKKIQSLMREGGNKKI